MIVHDGYELILGSSIDEQFEPSFPLALAGLFVEVFKDRALVFRHSIAHLRDG